MVERSDTAAAGGVFARSEQWLEKKYGKDRVVAAVVHRDEATPHLSAFVVPLTQDGRLSAKEFIGGRSKMRDDQSTYAESVKKLGLERGIEGSRATHQTVQHYYESINRGTRSQVSISPEALEPRVLRKGIFTKDVEDQAAIAKRLSHAVKRWLCRNHRYGLSERPECKKSARATEDYGFAAETPTERYRAF